ncbi:hypothetical protein MAP00_001347 [Monascus purpureus]|nr:hypothetical protein MAP00_001347 [Monascus purpureus]
MALNAPADSAGPSSPPPPLPEGWIAQWEGVSRKWYFVQRTTGKSQWEIPTEPVLTPSTTPTSTGTGPSRAPSSRPDMKFNPRPGEWPVATSADEAYYPGATKGPGLSSFFSSSQGNDPLGGLTQITLGMLGRLGNHNTATGQHGMMAQQTHTQQNPFGYSSAVQSGPYTGAAPEYHPPGQTALGHNVASATSTAMPTSSQPNSGPTQQLGSVSQGGMPSQFVQPVQPLQSHGQFQSAPTPPSGLGAQQPNAAPATTQAAMPQVSSNIYHPSQPQWQVGQPPPPPLSTKPTNNQHGMATPAGSAVQDPLNQSYHSQVPAEGYAQHQQQNLVQRPFGTKPAAQNLSHSANTITQQAHYSPAGQAYPGINAAGNLQPATGVPYSAHFPASQYGIPNGNQGYPMSQPVLQQTVVPSQSVGLHDQSFQNTHGQGSSIQQGTIGASSQYMGFNPAHPNPGPAFAASSHGQTGPMNLPTSVDHYGMSYVPVHEPNQPGLPWGTQIPPEKVVPFSHVPSVAHGPDGHSITPPNGESPHNYPMFQSQPSHSVAQAAVPSPAWTTHSGMMASRSATSDPQFVSGPWAAGIP